MVGVVLDLRVEGVEVGLNDLGWGDLDTIKQFHWYFWHVVEIVLGSSNPTSNQVR